MSICLYRMLGNNIPIRHSPNQTYDNLKFILENEPGLPGCEKRWMVNRIIDNRSVISLLEEFNQKYKIIEFIPEEYKLAKDYNEKNKYIANINACRNLMIRDCQDFDWIMPFDGGCFMSKSGWYDIHEELHFAPLGLKVFYVPVIRLTDNSKIPFNIIEDDFNEEVVLNGNRIRMLSEPQLIFSSKLNEYFNEDRVFGNDNKLDMLWRFGISGKWDLFKNPNRNEALKNKSKEFRRYKRAGYAFRLASGNPEVDIDLTIRQKARVDGMTALIKSLDENFINL